jgi:spoIIIJ-associated protein
MEESIRFAKKYLEDLLSFFGLNTDVYATCEEDVIELSVPSTHLNGFLIGQRGETLRALQFMVSTALKNNDHEIVRVNVDVADYKRHRRDRLAQDAEHWIEGVIKSGKARSLEPMNAADRRVVHKTVGEYTTVSSESEGEGRERHVVITPVAGADKPEKEEVESTEIEAEKESEEPETEESESKEESKEKELNET